MCALNNPLLIQSPDHIVQDPEIGEGFEFLRMGSNFLLGPMLYQLGYLSLSARRTNQIGTRSKL